MEPRFAAKAAPRRRKKVEALPEAGQAAAIMGARGATRVRLVVPRVRVEETKRAEETKQAEQTKRAGRIRGREASVRLRKKEIPD